MNHRQNQALAMKSNGSLALADHANDETRRKGRADHDRYGTRMKNANCELEELEKNFSKRERRGKKESDGEKEKKRSQSIHRR